MSAPSTPLEVPFGPSGTVVLRKMVLDEDAPLLHDWFSRDYARFCAFGRRLDAGLAERGAVPLFARIDVDNADADAIGRWRRINPRKLPRTMPASTWMWGCMNSH